MQLDDDEEDVRVYNKPPVCWVVPFVVKVSVIVFTTSEAERSRGERHRTRLRISFICGDSL